MYNKIIAFWQQRSLRFWLMSGLLITIIPFLIFSILTYTYINKRVVNPLLSLSEEQQAIFFPINQLQQATWGMSASVTDFLVSKQLAYKTKYEHEALKIKSAFRKLELASEIINTESLMEISRAKKQWQTIDKEARFILNNSQYNTMSDHKSSQKIIEFESKTESLGHTLGLIYGSIQSENDRLHKQSIDALISAEKLYLYVLFLSILFGIIGLIIINRSLISSLGKLTEGASKFATGDNKHTINIGIPLEMANVANTFNAMKKTIIEQRKELEFAAMIDGLTGLLNRRKFDELIEEKLEYANNTTTPLSLVIADIDHFKQFNNEYGHIGGDEALKTFAKIFGTAIHDDHYACRYGGEEFVILLPNCTINQAELIAEKLRVTVNNNVLTINTKKIPPLSASFGVASFPEHADTSEGLIEAADKALYKSKNTGRNRITRAQ
ncbi:diguanylate cyclase [Pseudoalteromonas sp. NEC-BIFX-2020_002]|uniref:sensor domain-containing diguanylate cyclase n=1 Tax=Pseudoalteromonas sp. NEC-BIFX-2020_002 TaxID=2732353 RepID=UPI001476E771|nr:diguanylate cyclase [Pseudoalteromonas sp. NEC-BIFX-2020_002]NNG42933.1 diguanylate cyclase [Pseudoalteromonas sp. NEC-BIFX-2020_002]